MYTPLRQQSTALQYIATHQTPNLSRRYLRSREPIAIFSNVFAADKAVCPTSDPCLRAAGTPPPPPHQHRFPV